MPVRRAPHTKNTRSIIIDPLGYSLSAAAGKLQEAQVATVLKVLKSLANSRSVWHVKPVDPGDIAIVEFLLCGSPNEAFYSQIAFFRLSLDRLGKQGWAARVVAVFGAEECPPLPARWAPYFDRIEVHYVTGEVFHRKQVLAANDRRFELLDPNAHCSCICDADTVLVRPLPADFLDELTRNPAVCGVVAHYPFPIAVDTRRPGMSGSFYPDMPRNVAWDLLSEKILGRAILRPLKYSLLEGATDDRCPFYVNYGFLAGPPSLLRRLHGAMDEIVPVLEKLLTGYFIGQIAIPLAVELAEIPWRALPMRFNFPNDRDADRLHPAELEQVILIHYLRDAIFDRHTIFSDPRYFDQFLAMTLDGSDRVFQNHVAEVTGGRYPFGGSTRSRAPRHSTVDTIRGVV